MKGSIGTIGGTTVPVGMIFASDLVSSVGPQLLLDGATLFVAVFTLVVAALAVLKIVPRREE